MIELRLDIMEGKVARLEDGLLKLSKDLKETRQELKNEIGAFRSELKEEIHQLGSLLDTVESRL